MAYQPDLVTFTSSSTSRNFCEMIGPDRIAKLKETARFAALLQDVQEGGKPPAGGDSGLRHGGEVTCKPISTGEMSLEVRGSSSPTPGGLGLT